MAGVSRKLWQGSGWEMVTGSSVVWEVGWRTSGTTKELWERPAHPPTLLAGLGHAGPCDWSSEWPFSVDVMRLLQMEKRRPGVFGEVTSPVSLVWWCLMTQPRNQPWLLLPPPLKGCSSGEAPALGTRELT